MLAYVDIADKRRLCLLQPAGEAFAISSLSPYDAYNFGALNGRGHGSLIKATSFIGDCGTLIASSADIAPVADPQICLSYHSSHQVDFSASLKAYFAEGRLVHAHDVFEVPILPEDARSTESAKFVRYRVGQIDWGIAEDRGDDVRISCTSKCAVIKTALTTLHQKGVSFSTMPHGPWAFGRGAFVAPCVGTTVYAARSTAIDAVLPVVDFLSVPTCHRILTTLRFLPLINALEERIKMQHCARDNNMVQHPLIMESSSDLQSRLLLQASCVALGLQYIEISADLLPLSMGHTTDDEWHARADVCTEPGIIFRHGRSTASSESALQEAVAQATRLYGQCVCHVLRLPQLCAGAGSDMSSQAARMHFMIDELGGAVKDACTPTTPPAAPAGNDGLGTIADAASWIEVQDDDEGGEVSIAAVSSPQFHPIVVVSATKSQLGEDWRQHGQSVHLNGPSATDTLRLFSLCLGSSLSPDAQQTLRSAADYHLRGATWDQVWGACNAVMDICALRRTEHISADEINQAFASLKELSPTSISTAGIPNVKWADVGGLQAAREEILRMVELPLKAGHLFSDSQQLRRGLLLFGPPGCGKTLLAKAIASECDLNFLSVKGPELLNMYVGESERNIRDLFERARAHAPCVLFFDELDSVAPARGRGVDSGGVMDRIVAQLLAQIDTLNDMSEPESDDLASVILPPGCPDLSAASPSKRQHFVFLVGATNRPDLLEPALLRPGRFDRSVFLGPPTSVESKVAVLTALTRNFVMDDTVDLGTIAKALPPGCTGADCYAVSSRAWTAALRNRTSADRILASSGSIVVKQSDFMDAATQLRPSVSPAQLAAFEKLCTQFSAIRD